MIVTVEHGHRSKVADAQIQRIGVCRIGSQDSERIVAVEFSDANGQCYAARIHSRDELDQYILALQRHGDMVWPPLS